MGVKAKQSRKQVEDRDAAEVASQRKAGRLAAKNSKRNTLESWRDRSSEYLSAFTEEVFKP